MTAPDTLARLVESGVTDFRLRGALPEDPAALEDHLSAAVSSFHASVPTG